MIMVIHDETTAEALSKVLLDGYDRSKIQEFSTYLQSILRRDLFIHVVESDDYIFDSDKLRNTDIEKEHIEIIINAATPFYKLMVE